MAEEKDKVSLSIRLELTEPTKVGDNWTAKAVATTVRGTWPAPNVAVRFYHDGMPAGDPETTDGEGRAVADFPDLKAGAHTFEAQVVADGPLVKTRKTTTIKEEKPKRATKLIVSQSAMGRGKYLLSFQTLNDEGAPVPATIKILDRSIPQGHLDLVTGKDGSQTQVFDVTAEKRILTITVPGTPIQPTVRTLYP